MLKNRHIREVFFLFLFLLTTLILSSSSAFLANQTSNPSSAVLAASSKYEPLERTEKNPVNLATNTLIAIKKYDQNVENTFVHWVTDVKGQMNDIFH